MHSPTLPLPLDRGREVDGAVSHFGVSSQAKEREMVSFQRVGEEKRHRWKIKGWSGEERVAIPLWCPCKLGKARWRSKGESLKLGPLLGPFFSLHTMGTARRKARRCLWCPGCNQLHQSPGSGEGSLPRGAGGEHEATPIPSGYPGFTAA